MILLNGAAIQAYRNTLPARLNQWLNQFIAAALCYHIDIPTLAAIIDRESLGGDALKPKGPAGYGDFSHGGPHGHGLGQIDDRSHAGFLHAKFWDGVSLWADPTFNILFAARLLRANLTAARGDLPLAIAAYNCGLKKARRFLDEKAGPNATEPQRIAALDLATANGNYVSHVLGMRAEYTPPEGAFNA